jgi:ABC-type multidrug transport system ATPase subunit
LGTLFISNHILSELETTGSHFTIINGGEIVSTGSLADINNPRLNSNVIADQIQFSSILKTTFVVFMDGGRFIKRQQSSSPHRIDSTNKARF